MPFEGVPAEDQSTPQEGASFKDFETAMKHMRERAEAEERAAEGGNVTPTMPADAVPVEIETTAEGVETAEYNPETAEGLRNLLDATEDIYSDIAALRQAAERDGFKTLIEQGMPPERAYTLFDRGYDRVASVQELVTELREERLPSGELVRLEEIDRLQSLIDILSDERRRVQQAYDRPAPAAPATTEYEAINRAWADVEGTTETELDEGAVSVVTDPENVEASTAESSTTSEETASVPSEASTEATDAERTEILKHAIFAEVDSNPNLTRGEREQVHGLYRHYQSLEGEADRRDFISQVWDKIDEIVSGRPPIQPPEAAGEPPAADATAAAEMSTQLEAVSAPRIFGMQLPEAGPAGVFGARSLREALLVTRDRHPELIKNPDKQLLVDQMVRQLRDVPATGLTADQVTVLEELTDKIGVSEGLFAKQTAAEDEPSEVATEVYDGPLVFGMRLPVAGSAGVLGARSLRAALLETRNRHPELTANPEKTALLDQMTELLGAVPETGLSEEQVAELHDLAKRIDIAEGLVSARPDEAKESPATRRRGEMEVASDPGDDGTVQIEVKGPAEDEPITEVSADPIETSASVTKETPIERVNRVIANRLGREREGRSREALNETTQVLLEDPAISEFVATRFSSPRAYERFLQAEVEKIEAETTDSIEKWLGESSAAMFETFLKDKTIAEFRELMNRDRETLREELRAMNLKYDTFAAWEDDFSNIENMLGELDSEQSFGELIAWWITMAEMSYFENGTNASQFTA